MGLNGGWLAGSNFQVSVLNVEPAEDARRVSNDPDELASLVKKFFRLLPVKPARGALLRIAARG